MFDSKSIFQSKTIWGIILMLFGFVLNYLGYNFDAEMQASILDQLLAYVPEISEAIGFILGVWGRISATKSVSL